MNMIKHKPVPVLAFHKHYKQLEVLYSSTMGVQYTSVRIRLNGYKRNCVLPSETITRDF